MGSRWRRERPPESAWRPLKGLGKAARQEEQDRTAGGRELRGKLLANGHIATASICLRVLPAGRRIYAYLRWSEDGNTKERYVGEVEGDTREDNLLTAWKIAHERALLGQTTANSSPVKPASVSESSRAVMRANKSKNTKPERLLRSAVFSLGLRYRIHARPIDSLRRTADMVFVRVKVAVFVDGCFWHGCPEHYRPAKRNTDFWETKIAANRQRDLDTDREFENHGWLVIRVWEHEPPTEAAARIAQAVATRRAPGELTSDP